MKRYTHTHENLLGNAVEFIADLLATNNTYSYYNNIDREIRMCTIVTQDVNIHIKVDATHEMTRVDEDLFSDADVDETQVYYYVTTEVYTSIGESECGPSMFYTKIDNGREHFAFEFKLDTYRDTIYYEMLTSIAVVLNNDPETNNIEEVKIDYVTYHNHDDEAELVIESFEDIM